ncbi:capsular polysaccharide biosynthesis protein CapF [Fusobacterium hominis]|uniref:Capsular polysaccharide biosynthesis protein CapF n=1 Tax=Fusobacterium hominis TaxID=2764326 RepID=A0A7G9GVF0_9FUSO|nr:capsular polysaccharide biosynthesis protein CapF [Fusobacterium hominis]QNM14782.1 capsular polysaccharide biosynthesis protein CapF [Fusobacterium hominis]
MKILITGAKGFVGRNLVENLKNIRDGKDKTHNISRDLEILEYDIDNTLEQLDEFCKKADFVFNLAGVNRPKNKEEFIEGNFGFASTLLENLKKYRNNCPVMLSSSIQATLEGRYAGSDYGKSKLAGEELFKEYSKETGAKVLIYRFPNLFGKWCRPNYNSAVATFCNNIANGLPIQVNDRNTELELVYIDDLVEELLRAIENNETKDEYGYCYVPEIHRASLGEIVDLLYSFKESRKNLFIPNLTEGSFEKKLYSTYLSYLDPKDFSYKLKMNVDNRGSFTELVKSLDRGQISINISKPGITKGQHWHNTKTEKFIVVAGTGIIQLRKIGTDEIVEYRVSGEEITVVDMIPGYTHNIINLSETEKLVTVMWCNECFNPERPDTFFEEV